MLLYIVRHGIPDYATDSLTPDGKKQAVAVARRLVLHGIDEVYSSPLGRAQQTAAPTCEALGLTMQIEPWMSEVLAWEHFCATDENGKNQTWAFTWQGRMLGREECYRQQDSFSHGYYLDDRLAAEGAAALARASDDFLRRLGYERTGEGNGYRILTPSNKRIAAFCHQGFGLHWLSHLLHIPTHVFTASFDISHTGVTILRFTDGGGGIAYPTCLALSDLSHIYGDELPLRYHNRLEI